MLGKTHFAVGIASSLMFTQPKTLQDVILAVGIGGIGALISDIDVDTSDSHKYANKIIAVSILIIIAVFAAEQIWSVGIIKQIISDSNYARIAIGTILFIAICAFGKQQPHRSFMHSILGLILLTASIGMIWQDLIPYFAIGFASHLIIDMFNFKKVRLFYPFKGGIALKLFHAHGLANSLFFLVGSALAIIQIVIYVIRICLNI
ncbi:MAG: metal-dependent hydrolase [Ruminococcus sp.]|nr:metal-dependent hydrolase [Ruminococcus sp.]